MVSRDGSRTRNVPLDLTYRNAEGPGVKSSTRASSGTARARDVQTNVDIEIPFNRVKSVTPHTGPLHGPNVIDASDLFVMPGLWDTHFHREREIRFFADRANRASSLRNDLDDGAGGRRL